MLELNCTKITPSLKETTKKAAKEIKCLLLYRIVNSRRQETIDF